MIDFDILKRRKELFARVTGVKLEHFLQIIEQVRPEWNKLQASKQCHGRNSNLKTLENEVMLALSFPFASLQLFTRFATSLMFVP